METDVHGLLTEEEWKRIVHRLPSKRTSDTDLIAMCQAQHQADVDAISAVENPIKGQVYGPDRERQETWVKCKWACLHALKAGGP